MSTLTRSQTVKQRFYTIGLLVRRNVKNQYYGSFIGVVWTVLNPLLNMVVMAFVFTAIFGREGIDLDYPVYVLSGTITFGLMRTGTSVSVASLVGRSDMLLKTRTQIEIFPTATVLSSLVTYGFSLIALLLVAGWRALPIFGGPYFTFTWNMLLIVLIVPAIVLFTLGISYFLSALYVFFRDVRHLYDVFLTLWYYLTPVFYNMKALNSNTVLKFENFNPMYYYVNATRECLEGLIPSGQTWLLMYLFGLISLAIGWTFLHLLRNKITIHL
ncbi:MAG: ABC transporter permease [Clostridia bacterium]|nr:ABC transporter permease [Clostridia bacterium]